MTATRTARRAVRFTESDVDQARAAGVLVEFENARPIIVDRSLYRELSKQAIKRTVEDLRIGVAEVAQERKAAKASGRPVDPEAEARRERGRELRAIAEQAHGANLDLGWGLMNGLATVDPADMAVAKFFVFAVLGADYDQSPYTQTGDRVAELAARGVRLVIEEFRTDVTKTRKDGSRGALRIDYGDPRKPEKPIAWLWKFIDGAKTAGELYGRALVVIAAEQYASRLVVPSSQQHSPMRWPSHKDHARKALAKLAGPHLPATLKQVEKAVAKAHAEHEKATSGRTTTSRAAGGVDEQSVAEPPAVEELDVDQARAAGVLVEFENARPIIVDRSLYRELSKQAIKRTVEDLRTGWPRSRRNARPPRRPAGRSIRKPRRGESGGASCARSPSRRTARTSISAGD